MLFILLIFGLITGSFLNMLIDRIPRGEQIVKGRSKCDNCKHELSWQDLIPVVSWLWLRGKCRYCGTHIPMRNTIVELITGGLFVLTGFILVPEITESATVVDIFHLLGFLTIVSALIAIFFIDLKHYIIPDTLTIVIGVCALLLLFPLPHPTYPLPYILSAIGAMAFFLTLVLITKGKGMGMGDVKFAFVMGLLLGYPHIIIALYVAFLTGAGLAAILILRGKKRFGQVVPFGPFLVFGTLIVLFEGIPATYLSYLFPYLYQ